MDLLAEGVLLPDDYRHKHESLKNRQHDLVSLIHAYDEADSSFGGMMEKLMKVAIDAHRAFQNSNLEDRRELLNFVFSKLCLKGATLCHTYNFPFGVFENMGDCSKWRREWDSNPRGSVIPTRFPGVHLQPLGHLSTRFIKVVYNLY